MENQKKTIRGFKDLEVYQTSYENALIVARKILPSIPSKERYDLVDQLSRSSKAIPRLIAEGYAKKHQKAGFQKYLDDANAECNETIVSLEQVRDIYGVETELCTRLVNSYDVTARQLFRLADAWSNFTNRRHKTTPPNLTSSHTLNP